MSVTVALPANGTLLSIHNWADSGAANVRSYLNNYGIKFVEGRYLACLDYDEPTSTVKLKGSARETSVLKVSSRYRAHVCDATIKQSANRSPRIFLSR